MKERLKQLGELITNEDKNEATNPGRKGGAICSMPTLKIYLEGNGETIKTILKLIAFFEERLGLEPSNYDSLYLSNRLIQLSKEISLEDKNEACKKRKGGALVTRPTLDKYLRGNIEKISMSENLISFFEKRLSKKVKGIDKILNN